jgi:hypothetical protein
VDVACTHPGCDCGFDSRGSDAVDAFPYDALLNEAMEYHEHLPGGDLIHRLAVALAELRPAQRGTRITWNERGERLVNGAAVHILMAGRALCRPGTPDTWPSGERWVRFDDPADATCAECLRILPQIESNTYVTREQADAYAASRLEALEADALKHLASALKKVLPRAMLAELLARIDPLTPFLEAVTGECRSHGRDFDKRCPRCRYLMKKG